MIMNCWRFILLLLVIWCTTWWTNGEPNAVSLHPENDQLKQDNGVEIETEEENDQQVEPQVPEFVPSHEWQIIKPGQSIPKGLHVRVNLQTGKKEAKLMSDDPASPQVDSGNSKASRMKEEIEKVMKELESQKSEDKDEEDMKYWKLGDRQGMMNNKKTFSRQELKEALKKFKANTGDFEGGQVDALKKFKDINEIKSDFKKMDMGIKTDVEILRELLQKYNKSDLGVEEKKSILIDLEYYLHQIDNAQDFVAMGGLDLVIKDLNHTDPSVKSEAAHVLGSALQSNPKVQIHVIKEGCLHWLLHMLVAEQQETTRTKVLYAISSLVRHFPFAQEKFLQLGGLTAFSKLFAERATQKLQLKAVTLINDLLVEKISTLSNYDPSDSVQKEKVRQYKKILLLEGLIEQGWCDLVATLLDVDEHDSREKVIAAMKTLADYCKSSFVKSQSRLGRLKAEYEKLSAEEKLEGDGDDYFQVLHKTVSSVLSRIAIKDEL